jgi:hypothetical protein
MNNFLTSRPSKNSTPHHNARAGLRAGIWILFGVCILAFGISTTRAADAPASTRDPVRVDEKTDAVIKGALKWLGSKQSPNGAWAGTEMELQHPIAITAYALMAFQAAGHLPNEGEYGKQVALGMQYLIDSIATDGLMGNKNNGQYMYGHGVATIALAELYGQTKSPTARVKLDKIVKTIVSSQNNEGGWRYRPIAYQADISVTVLQIVGLRAAKNAGLDVPQATIDRAISYVKACYHAPSGGFCYQPGQTPGFARTAAAIYSLQVCGLYDDPMVKAGSDYLLRTFKDSRAEWFTYGNFYAAPAMYMRGGETWEKWYKLINDALVKKATVRGDTAFWDPNETGLEGGRSVGPIYTTSVYTMMLAMPYHYIPLYQR